MTAIDYRCTLEVLAVSSTELESVCGSIMDALMDIEAGGNGTMDAAVSVDLGTKLVDIELIARADTYAAAEALADSTVRAAIHAAGGGTGGWQYTPSVHLTELAPA